METLDSLGLREIYVEKFMPFRDAFERLWPFAVYKNEEDLLTAGLRAKADEIAARVREDALAVGREP